MKHTQWHARPEIYLWKFAILNLIEAGFLALALSLGLTAPVAAGPREDAAVAYKRGDYVAALLLSRPLADQGDAGSQWMLGQMYENGRGVPRDYVQAVNWYYKAAGQGYAAAQYGLGDMYDSGQGVAQD